MALRFERDEPSPPPQPPITKIVAEPPATKTYLCQIELDREVSRPYSVSIGKFEGGKFWAHPMSGKELRKVIEMCEVALWEVEP